MLITLQLYLLFSISAQNNVDQKWILKLAPQTPPAALKSLMAKSNMNLEFHANSQYISIQLEGAYTKKNIKDAKEIFQLRKSVSILDFEQNTPFQLSTIPNDARILHQWSLDNQGQAGGNIGADIHAFAAWDIQTVGEGILGIIDTGIDYTHPDVAENIWQNLAEDADEDGKVLEKINGIWQLDPGDLDGIDADNNGYIDDLIGWDFVENDNNPFDDNGHGTHVAGIIGAKGNNNIGVTGIAWSSQLMALKAFDRYGTGQLSNILPALEYARKMGVLLTNNSWGSIHYSQFLLEEILEAEKDNQLFVAAAGNNGRFNPHTPVYPAAYSLQNIISVAASDDKDRVASFSSYHPDWVDICAPGKNMYSCLPGNEYGYKSGTSMAAPMVAGALSLLHAKNPSLNPRDMVYAVLAQADIKADLFGSSRSGGRLNLFKLLSFQNKQRLQAHFEGPMEACINTPIEFKNTSKTQDPDLSTYRWEVNGQFAGKDSNLTYSFDQTAWYEVKLIVREGNKSDEYLSPIHIKEKAEADLGNDTSICAAAFVLFANSTDHNISWKRYCPPPGNCYSIKDDSIRLGTYGGDLMQLDDQRYILTDSLDQIVEISNQPVFSANHPIGNYNAYGLYFESAQPPQGLVLGQRKSDLDFGLGSCHTLSNSVEIAFSQTQTLGNKPMLRIRESGMYILEIEDACGNIARDTLDVQLSGECVWPGDINADGMVSLIDFLALGVANGASGDSRINPSTEWKGQTATNWNQAFAPENFLAPAINFKHADANGDGLVDLLHDKQAINQNLGFDYLLDSLPTHSGISFALEHVNTIFYGDGDTAAIEIAMHLEAEGSKDVQDFYGATFSLNFSDPISRMPTLDFNNSWLGPMEQLGLFADGSRNSFGSQFLPRDRKRLSFGMVSSNRTSSFGRGRIAGTIIIVVADDIVEDSLRSGISGFSISSDYMMIIDANGNPVSTISANSLDALDVEIDWSQAKQIQDTSSLPFGATEFNAKQESNLLIAHPNPFDDILIVEYAIPQETNGELNIFNGVGQRVHNIQIAPDRNTLQLDTSSWAKGIYFLKLQIGQKSYVYKFIKQS